MTSSRSGFKLGLMKKLSLYIFLGLLFSLVTSQAILAGCKIPKKPREKIVEAPEAVLKKQKILNNEGSDTQIIITKYLAIAKNKKDNLVTMKSQKYSFASEAKDDVIKKCKLFFMPYGEKMQNACYVDKVIEKKEKIKTIKNRIEKVLSKRRTVNVFKAWNRRIKDSEEKPYGLMWSGSRDNILQSNVSFAHKPYDAGEEDSLILHEQYWAYFFPENGISETSKYYTNIRFVFDPWELKSTEYGFARKLNYHHPDWPNHLALRALSMKEIGYHGVMFDLWKNSHPNDKKPYWPSSKKAQKKVQEGRLKIAKTIREKLGDDFIILGNTNYEKDKSIHKYMNGVFLEFWKEKNQGGYSCKKISEMEDVIKFHDQHLSEPRIIAVDAWRVTKKFSGREWDKGLGHVTTLIEKDRRSPENIKFAKLFAAMAMVIPENGYISYVDNNWEPFPDHFGVYYDFYNIDLGKAISNGTEITEGLSYKKYEKGLIAYNRTKFKYTIKFKDGRKVEIGPLEGVFVKD